MKDNKRPQCTIPGCDKKHHAKGLCGKHYARLLTHGDPNKSMRVLTDSPEESFALRTKWVNSCLIWTGTRNRAGYGQITVKGKQLSSHRYAWERSRGPIPEGMYVDHVCYIKACVNVEHLRLATPSQNIANKPKVPSSNTSGVMNVFRARGGWKVQVVAQGTLHYYGQFSSIEEARQVAIQARRELFGEFAGEAIK